jgi:hypothetical protein
MIGCKGVVSRQEGNSFLERHGAGKTLRALQRANREGGAICRKPARVLSRIPDARCVSIRALGSSLSLDH